MSNYTEGYICFNNADIQTVQWFRDQWRLWPKRVDERYTTNIGFLYGAYKACVEDGFIPMVSDQLASHFNQMEAMSYD